MSPGLSSADAAPPAAPSLAAATRFWLKLGFISFGGPAGQIAILHEELVVRRRWISEQRFLHALNYCMLLPGPEAQQLATYIGWLLHRARGGIVAGGLFVLPSLFILIALSWLYVSYGQLGWVAALLYGVKPAVVAIVVQAAHRIASRSLRNPWLWAIATLSFIGIAVLQLAFPWIIAGAAVIGWLGGRWAPASFHGSSAHAKAAAQSASPALIDDHTPVPAHAQFAWWRLARVLGAGALLWALPMVALNTALGWQHTLTQLAWFFTKAALLTFGGAYAVLPYVTQAAVLDYRWLQPGQMIDGLALGETTPGPLIMVVAFVGFLAGSGSGEVRALIGGSAAAGFMAGAVAATLVTWFTFLPSFIFILAGGPLVERTRHELAITGPLTAVTAAVVGVIVSLGLFFGYHVWWPGGRGASLDLFAITLTAAAAVALLVFRQNLLRVIGLAALAGLIYRGFPF